MKACRGKAARAVNRSSSAAPITAPNVFGYWSRPPSLAPAAATSRSAVRRIAPGHGRQP
ncbi:hypothetical protein [Paenibacillus apis]|uniref:hypothetical protein n=1 Tax=Paenibacillus apis TaxID=1792174 RepID=UPI00265989B6|nr:hypothetical protein [Paenibacillus apis]